MNNKKISKYTSTYMSLGMCLGISMGLIFGNTMFDGNTGVGMCLGLSIGMCIGLAIGSQKDKKLSENLMEVTAVEQETDGFDVHVIDKDGTEKIYKVTRKTMTSEKIAVGSIVADDNGTLVAAK